MFTPFYFSTIRKYITLFGTLFNDIRITRTDADSHVTVLERVPITYGPKDKMLARVIQDPAIDRPTATYPLPMMSFEMTSFSYDGSRKLETIARLVSTSTTDASKQIFQYTPVPYNIGFELSVMVKNAEDGNKIVEQILPYFTPDWTTPIHLIPEMGINMNIPIILNSVQLNDSYDGNFTQRRAMIWTLNFVLKGYLYGPVKTSKVIKFANTEFFVANTVNIQDSVGALPATAWVHVQPGLTANGQPTTNSALSP